MPPGELAFLVLVFALAAIIPVWALIAGGQAERIAAVLFLLATLASKVVEQASPPRHAGVVFLAIDGVMAIGFMSLALLYRHMWISLMMFAMAGFFAIHAFYEISERDLDPTFAFVSNLATLVLLVSLALGVWSSRRRGSGTG